MEKLLKKADSKKIILFFIFLLALVLRFFQLGKAPLAMNRDEPAIGYNAYSILKTGRDEWGKRFPLSFKSFGDYKSPLYIYLTVFPVAFFDLNEFSVRFISALSGSLTVLVIYLLTKELFVKNSNSNYLPITASLLLAISPWHIFFSRFSYEANLALFFNALILYFLVKNNFQEINLKLLFLILLSIFTYSGSLIIWPLFIVIWILFLLKKIVFKQKEKKTLKTLFQLLFCFFIIAFVLYQQFSIGRQKSGITIFNNPQIILDFNKERTRIFREISWRAALFYNQYLYMGKVFFLNYFKSFSYNFIFGGGGAHPWHKILQMPHFYPVFLILILLGVFIFLKKNTLKKEKRFFFLLLLALTIIPSAITTDSPHATRLLNFFFLLIFFLAL